MDVDMKNKEDNDDKAIVAPTNGGNGRDHRDYDRDKDRDARDRDYDRDRDRRDRDKDRDRERDRDRRDSVRSGRPRPGGDHWEPERRGSDLARVISVEGGPGLALALAGVQLPPGGGAALAPAHPADRGPALALAAETAAQPTSRARSAGP
ncbi:hypothetical protein CVT26_011103 [Gymnopilus dilepis]|uniref:Uncharacterized protein n=1 Tax=Gymnopilus dilepis TaxID=231916 RepID=A0A409WRH5_9AGAR|nr:hypothetical protein CVT26_011103 [Gymnopilus dilepis]